MAPIIEVRNVSKRFGNLLAVDDCSISVEEGSITGLIGPNGAGKTTLFNMVAGVFPPSGGRILLAGEDVTGLAAHELYHRGLLRTFQIAHEFSHLTALENLMVVPAGQSGENLFSAWLRPAPGLAQEAEVRRKAADVIGFLGLDHVRNEPAGNLSGGQKKLLELGRVMMASRAWCCSTRSPPASTGRCCSPSWRHRAAQPGARPDLLRHRARHGRDRAAVRSGHRDGRGLGHDAGLDGRDPQQPAGDRGLFRRRPAAGGASVSLLEMSDVHAGYGGAMILQGVAIDIEAQEIGVVIGPNGAGKSTALKALFGLLHVAPGPHQLRRRRHHQRRARRSSSASGCPSCRRNSTSSPRSPSRRTSRWAPTSGATRGAT
jgi:ABC-type branched-subunit amino acid transport system ATPase component